MPKASDYGPFDVFCIHDLWYAKDHTNFSCGPWGTKEEAEFERDLIKSSFGYGGSVENESNQGEKEHE